MASPTSLRWISASRTHVGLVREVNEDACLDLPDSTLWAVADGMGGHTLGDMASLNVVTALSAIPPAGTLGEFSRAVQEQLQSVNRQLRQEAFDRNVQVIGSTVVVLFTCDRHCGYLWAGDSRIYLYRDGQLTRLTRDHSQVEELLSQGILTPEEAANHPLRNLITRAVGSTDTLDLDEGTLEAKDGDLFLLCSDGLSNEVSEQKICATLVGRNCSQATEILIDLALKHGGRDNISVVVVRAEEVMNVDKTELNPIFL